MLILLILKWISLIVLNPFMPRGSSLNQLLGTKLYQCQRTAFENLKCPWKAQVLILPRKMELLGYFSKLEKTSQATRSGETSSYPTLPVRDAKVINAGPWKAVAAQFMVQRGRMPDSSGVSVV